MSFANEIWLAIRNDVADGEASNVPGSPPPGSPGNPYAANTSDGFAKIMGDASKGNKQNALIRLGPGAFRTRGTGGNGVVSVPQAQLWLPQLGQRIVGSGMFATTLQFLWDVPPTGHPGQRHNMISSALYLDSLELSDLTLDCNLQNTPFDTSPVLYPPGSATLVHLQTTVTTTVSFFNQGMVGKIGYFFKDEVAPLQDVVFSAKILSVQSGTQATLDGAPNFGGAATKTGVSFWVFWPKFTVTAASIVGSNVLMRRLRIINFGTRTPFLFDGLSTYPGPNRTYEGFPLRVESRTATKPAFNCTIENCIFEQPFSGPGREVTCAVMGGGTNLAAIADQPLHLRPFGSVLRNCYFNFDYTNPLPGHPVKVVSASYASGELTVNTEFPADVGVNDYVEIYGSSPNNIDGRWKVTGVGAPDATSKLVLSFKFALASDPGLVTNGFAFKSPAQTMPISSLTRSGSTITVTTGTKHHRSQGQPIDWFTRLHAIFQQLLARWELGMKERDSPA